MVTPIELTQEMFRSRFEGERKDGGRYVASRSKQRRVLLVFVVKSQRKLRLRRNEKHFDEDSKENAKEDLSVALQEEKSRACFTSLPVAKSRSKVFDFLKNCGVCVHVGHKRSGGWGCLTSIIAN
ncbi:hypothetical protein F2Q69_00013827 [Brassica cretica]|uniref:Uncharacterized protein n=1 Tax=Brassica cretica TaxID=69181 RepID=A0A8S9R0X9_BRACR|nr:hypothetical protein F2Q69_00013827 [Brassica cretica]